MGKEAHDLERQVLAWAALDPRIARLNKLNVAFRVAGRFVQAVERGWPDLIGFTHHGHSLLWEVKTPKDTVSQQQEEFLDAAVKAGCCAGVIRSLADAQALLDNFYRRTP